MAEATIKDVRDFFNSPERPLSLSELKADWNALTEEDRQNLKDGIGDGTFNY